MDGDKSEAEAREAAAREIARLLVVPSDLKDSSLRILHEDLVQRRATEEGRIRHLQSSRLDQASIGYILGRNCSLWSQLLRRYEAVDEVLGSSQIGFALRNDTVKTVNRALWNVQSVLFLVKFYEELSSELKKLMDEVGSCRDNDLFRSHVKLLAFERMRELALIDCGDLENEKNHFLNMFNALISIRHAIESRMWKLLREARTVGVNDPRALVACARTIEEEEAEDQWWKEYAAANREQDALKQRPLRGVRERALLEIRNSVKQRTSAAFKSQTVASLGSEENVISTIAIATELVDDLTSVQQHVTPCFPDSYDIYPLYVREYNKQLLARISELLNSTVPLSEASYVRIINWYAEYRLQLQKEQKDEALEKELDASLNPKDRQTLARHYQKHFTEVMSRMIEKIVDIVRDVQNGEYLFELQPKLFKATKAPDEVFNLARFQIREASIVSNGEELSKHAETIGEILILYAKKMTDILKGKDSVMPTMELNAIITNDASRCLENAEELKEWLYSLLDQEYHSKVDGLGKVLDRFHELESLAKSVILKTLFDEIGGSLDKLFTRSSGTEVVLDIVETLEDYLKELSLGLIDYHFREIVLSCMERLVDRYLSAFVVAESGPDTKGTAVRVQIGKDVNNLEKVFSQFVKKRLFEDRFAPLRALNALFTCLPSVGEVKNAYMNIASLWPRCSPAIVERVLRMRPEIDSFTYKECLRQCKALPTAQNANAEEGRSSAEGVAAEIAQLQYSRRRSKPTLVWKMHRRNSSQGKT